MEICMLWLGLALASQIADPADDRYPAAEASLPLATTVLPATTVEKSSPTVKPSKLLGDLLTPPLDGQLSGAPLSLVEAVGGANSREEQTRRVELYWELATAVADYYVAVRSATEIRALRDGITQPDPSWSLAESRYRERANATRRRAELLQRRLRDRLGQSAAVDLPLPRDMPHCGAYMTRHDEIFGDRPTSSEAQMLHELLPMQYQALRQEANRIALEHQRLDEASRRRSPQSGGAKLLQAFETIVVRRQNFLNTVRDYNLSIAHYSQIALPERVAPQRLVATLIQIPVSDRWRPSNIQRTSSEEPLNKDDGAERSILVRP